MKAIIAVIAALRLPMKRIILSLFVLSAVSALAQLRVPSIAYGTAAISAQDSLVYDYPSIGTNPTFQHAETVTFSPANLQFVVKTGAAPFPNCVRTDGGTPTATVAGTCDAPATTYTFGGTNTLNITGSVTLTAIATGVGQTNSAMVTSFITVQPFYPAPGTYSYSPFATTLTGVLGGNVIFTTNGTTPTANGSCVATNGTAAANGVQVTVPATTTEVIKFISCLAGVTGAVQTGTFTTRAPITWYVTPTGGTRNSSNVTAGLCNGQANAAPSGGTPNQNCAFSDFRYLWDDDSGSVLNGSWVIAGGDTVIVVGCNPSANQVNPSGPNCRIGWDNPNGGGATNLWCQFVGNNACINPTIPSGSPSQPTRILGANYAACATGGQTNPRNYAPGQMAQLFAGFGLTWSFDLRDTQNVTIGCLEFTTHNGACVSSGNPAYPRSCSNNPPIDDFANNGWYLNRNSVVTFQDVYTHGFNSSGMFGPFASVTMTRVFVGFNASAAWQMDDGHTTPNGVLASLITSYVTLGGNGCNEEYPIIHSFSAQACYDDNSNGFGDSLSGQDTQLDTLVWDHGLNYYNTKDAFIGPHPLIKHLTITNSTAYGSSGSQWKFITDIGATLVFENNLTIGNCNRMAYALPGAAHTFDRASGLGGAYLSDYCRAGGNTMGSNMRANNNWLMANNTFVGFTGYHLQISCGMAYWNNDGTCGASVWNVTNNIFLGYTLQSLGVGPSLALPTGGTPEGSSTPDTSVVPIFSHNIDFGNKPASGVTCGSNGNLCSDPQLVSEPIQQPGGWTNTTFLDNFNFLPSSTSPAIGTGTSYTGSPAKDFAGVNSTSPLVIGALNFAGVGTLNTITVLPTSATITVGATQPFTATCAYSDGSTTPCSGTWTDTGTHSTVGSTTGVVTGTSVGTDTNTITYTISGVFGTASITVNAVPLFFQMQGASIRGRTN